MYFDILRNPDSIYVETDTGWERLEPAGNGDWSWSFQRIEVSFTSKDAEWQVYLHAPSDPLRTIKLSWKTRPDNKMVYLGDHWERSYGDLEWRGLVPERIMPWYFLSYDGAVTNGYGVKTGPNAMCSWQVDAEGVYLTADVRCSHLGVRLEERMLHVCSVITHLGIEGESPFSAARSFCAQMCERAVLPDHPVYGGNNWYYAYGKSSHDRILEDSGFISSLSDSSNRPYMVIDDGWQLSSGGGATNGGPWTGNYLFPDMPKLASEMKLAGVKPGLWFRPLLVNFNVPQGWKRYQNKGVVLDPSVPDVLAHVEETIRTMVSWGYGLIKHDFTTFDLFGKWGFEAGRSMNGLSHSFNDLTRTTAEIVLDLYKTIASASGDSVIIGCNTIGHLAAGLFELQRTGDDTSGKSWERTRRMGVNTLAFRMPQHETFFAHDADCVGVTERVPWELNRQWLRLLAESGTPLFVSADPAVMTGEQIAAIKMAFETASRPMAAAEPLDWLSTTCPSRWRLKGDIVEFSWTNQRPDFAETDNTWWL